MNVQDRDCIVCCGAAAGRGAAAGYIPVRNFKMDVWAEEKDHYGWETSADNKLDLERIFWFNLGYKHLILI